MLYEGCILCALGINIYAIKSTLCHLKHLSKFGIVEDWSIATDLSLNRSSRHGHIFYIDLSGCMTKI